MKWDRRTSWRIAAATGSAALVVGAAPGIASAAPTHFSGNYTCTGTAASPGTLAGNFANVTITGTCLADAGNVNVAGNLIIAQNASLVADFGQNDKTHYGTSNLRVGGNMIVEKGGSTLLGCYPLSVTLWGAGSPPALFSTPDFPCDDEVDPLNSPVLSATEYIGGNLIAYQPLGIVVHNTTVHGSVIQYGGGNGTAFDPVGIFAVYIPGGPPAAPGQFDAPAPLPAYSDFSNVKTGGSMILTGMDTSWYGIIRNTVRGSLIDTNNTTAPDGNEMSANTVYGDLVCSGNNPAVEYGDSDGVPTKVGGTATGECGFNVMIPNPSPDSVPGLPSYPLTHVSVHLHH